MKVNPFLKEKLHDITWHEWVSSFSKKRYNDFLMEIAGIKFIQNSVDYSNDIYIIDEEKFLMFLLSNKEVFDEKI